MECCHEQDITLHGRKVVGGCAEGEALVTRDTISGWGGVNPMTGTIIETRHELRGVSFKDKVLVFPGAKGSSGWSAVFHMTRLTGTAPKAMLFNEMTTKIALGAVVMRVPSVTELDQDPLDGHRDRRLGEGRRRPRHRRSHQSARSRNPRRQPAKTTLFAGGRARCPLKLRNAISAKSTTATQ